MKIGISVTGFAHPIKKAEGSSTIKAIKTPLKIGLIFSSTEAVKNPMTIHIESADKFASQVRP